MSQLNSILALKLQRQERMAQQEREDRVQQDATMQASMQHLISGQQRLADQQLARDEWKLKFEQQKYQMELARQKQDLEHRKYVEESRWNRMKDTVEMNKDAAQASLFAREAKEPKLFRGQTNIGLTSGQKLGLGGDLISQAQKESQMAWEIEEARAARLMKDAESLDKDLRNPSVAKMGSSKRRRYLDSLSKTWNVPVDQLPAHADALRREAQDIEARRPLYLQRQQDFSSIAHDQMTTSGVRQSIERIREKPLQRTIGPLGSAPQPRKITAPPPTATPGGVDPAVQAVYDKHKQ